MSQFRPMLGAKVEDFNKLRFPLYVSPKLDGIRAIWWGKEFISRTLKTIPNRVIQKQFSELWIPAALPAGWDGELICGEPNDKRVYGKTESAVMSKTAIPPEQVRFFVFDNCEASGDFEHRLSTLYDISPLVVKLDQTLVDNLHDLLELETRYLSEGYEGVILRHPGGPYKHGRSTFREQYLLKLKRFTDAEAKVIGFTELEHNANELQTDERGYAKRSSHSDNKVGMETLGALICEFRGVQFNIGTGFTAADRSLIWRSRDSYLGRLAKFKYLDIGIKTAPRHPVFLGWRSEIDL